MHRRRDMNIRFQGSLTKDEFKNSIKLANRPVLKTSGIHFELWVILLIAGIAMILIGLRMLFLAINLSGLVPGPSRLSILGALLSE